MRTFPCALIAVAALAAGARDRSVIAFGVVAILGTAGWGTALSLGIGTHLTQIDWLALIPVGRVGATIELAIAILCWPGL